MAKKNKDNGLENLRGMDKEGLKEKLVSLRKHLLELRIKELKNPHEKRWARRDIAKVLTILNEKTRGEIVGKSK